MSKVTREEVDDIIKDIFPVEYLLSPENAEVFNALLEEEAEKYNFKKRQNIKPPNLRESRRERRQNRRYE